VHPRNRLKFSVHDICKLWSDCSHCKHDLQLFDEWPVLSSHEMMIIVNHDTECDNIYIELEVSIEHIPGMERPWL